MRTNLNRSRYTKSTLRRAFTQAELVVSVFIVGILLVSSLSTVGASRKNSFTESSRPLAVGLAEDLLAEIQNLSIIDPDCKCGYGVESLEGTTNRSAFDDVDDYNGLSDTPPKQKDGTNIVGFTGWKRTVKIERVTSTDWKLTSSTYQGNYRITIQVFRGTVKVFELIAYRTDASSPIPDLSTI